MSFQPAGGKEGGIWQDENYRFALSHVLFIVTRKHRDLMPNDPARVVDIKISFMVYRKARLFALATERRYSDTDNIGYLTTLFGTPIPLVFKVLNFNGSLTLVKSTSRHARVSHTLHT